MASKNTDIIEVLADTIVSNLTTPVSKRGKETAPNDKTFPAVILGINQKFTDDVSEQDKAAIIEKFSIPEAVEEGEQAYYTFKINGAYYCKQQNGNFKLYDDIMVYIPNGNWSKMYLDYNNADSKNGNSNNGYADLPDIIIAPDAPGGDPVESDLWFVVNDDSATAFRDITSDSFTAMYSYAPNDDEILSWQNVKPIISKTDPSGKVGDYWIKINDDDEFIQLSICTESTSISTTWAEIYPNSETGSTPTILISLDRPMTDGDYWCDIDNENDKNLEAVYKYEMNVDEQQYEWALQFNIKSGGGVGEWLDDVHTIERFNDYSTYTVDLEELTHSGGNYSNGKYDHIEGKGNASLVSQYVDSPKANHVGGQDNTLYNCERTSCPSGQGNVAKQLNDSIIFGRYVRKLYDSSSYGCLLGGLNVILNGYIHACLVLGEYFSLNQVRKSAVFGESLTMLGEIFDSLVCGSHHQQGSSEILYRSVLAGQSINPVSVYDSLLCGARNNIIYSNSSMICGEQHQCSMATDAVVCGIGAQVNQSAQIIVAGNGTQSSPRNVFEVNKQGYVTATAYNTSGADYAEYFEWSDGNPDNEFRVGLLVSLDGDKIQLANGDDILGVISIAPSVVGNSAEFHYHDKYVKDVYGNLVMAKNGEPLISPDYDPAREYIPRSQRPEWAAVGLVGRLVVRDDGTCKVGNWIEADNGYAITSSKKTNVKMLKRIDENHIEVIIK